MKNDVGISGANGNWVASSSDIMLAFFQFTVKIGEQNPVISIVGFCVGGLTRKQSGFPLNIWIMMFAALLPA